MPAIRKCSHANSGQNGGDIDTLNKLRIYGPLEDGDVPSKVSRNHLIENGYARRIKEPWTTKITMKGRFAFYIWRIWGVRI